MPITLAGSTGITTPGMESAAMPTVAGDAVVESGSNSDGEWVRWADGTQSCHLLREESLAINSGQTNGFYHAFVSWDFPMAFTAPPFSQLVGRSVGKVTPTAVSHEDTIAGAQVASISGYLISATSVSASPFLLRFHAHGRWK